MEILRIKFLRCVSREIALCDGNKSNLIKQLIHAIVSRFPLHQTRGRITGDASQILLSACFDLDLIPVCAILETILRPGSFVRRVNFKMCIGWFEIRVTEKFYRRSKRNRFLYKKVFSPVT
jgi:hypothetical protein